ncbi:autotransporter assembly complex protein TamA [Phyllobacterium leguminum]|uniref:Autotransporter secretion outer membrane protein TamA n=1 Tax=Phyllobacterium leguminum TaxID=314237 RepID=A0A318T5A0_9HYPH|nr:autotransporter assembly complex family protein [Phyllobacterium leguminum]PYE89287.1 autotransporter secretion outer membrane protein TamA [Phyllobacterium leguminum]
MRGPFRKIGIFALLLTGQVSPLGVSPAAAFDLFGIHLWGEKKETADASITDPKRYKVQVAITGNARNHDGRESDAKETVEGASSLVADEDKPVSGAAGLLAKARGDYRRILQALYGDGRYGGTISIKVNGREAADIPIDAELPSESAVVISVDPGPQFLFARTSISELAPPPSDPRDAVKSSEDEGFAPGKVAVSGTIVKAELLAVDGWRRQGFAKAKTTKESVVADHRNDSVDVDIAVDPGRRAHYGSVAVKGTERMDPQFVARQTGLKPGEVYNPRDIERARKRLNRLEVFRAATITEADEIEPDGTLPMTLTVQERPLRRFGVGGSYSTLDGAGLETYWMHRNLFGKAERLRFDAKVSGVGSTDKKAFDPKNYSYLAGVTFTKPGIFTPDTDFVSSLIAEQEVLDAYTRTAITAQAGLTHIFNDELKGRAFATVSRARFDDDYFGKRDFLTAGVLGGLTYDSRDKPADATSGYFLEGVVEPFHEFEYGNFAAKFTAEGRTYYGFGEDDRVVLAGRLKLGALAGPSASELPPDKLFFAGGGGSIRGYAYRNVGVVTSTGVVIGGRSLVETSAEVRARVTEDIGIVGFVDAGYVGENTLPDFSEEMSIGVGGGVRYQTGLGPIRLDVAVPLNRRHGDPSVAFYVGIGQAF